MTTPRPQRQTPPDHPVAWVVATLFAPGVILGPLFLLIASQDESGRAAAVAGMYVVSVLVAGVLLFAAGRRGRARTLEVGFIWILAGAAAAAVYSQPTGSDMGGGVPFDIVLGAFLGAFTSPIFAGLYNLFRPSAG